MKTAKQGFFLRNYSNHPAEQPALVVPVFRAEKEPCPVVSAGYSEDAGMIRVYLVRHLPEETAQDFTG